jgi:integrase
MRRIEVRRKRSANTASWTSEASPLGCDATRHQADVSTTNVASRWSSSRGRQELAPRAPAALPPGRQELAPRAPAVPRPRAPVSGALGSRLPAPEVPEKYPQQYRTPQPPSTLDAAAREDGPHVHRRAILAVLLFGGLRIGEACDLRWRNVDLATGWLTVGHAKTDAGSGRRVKIRGALRDVLLTIKPADASPDAYVFATRGGGRPNPSNVRNRVLIRAVEMACEQLVDRGGTPLPHLTPHSCRRTFASALYALGEAPPVVMAEMGHTSPNLALRIYAQAMRRTPEENERLRARVEGREVAVIGSRAAGTHAATADISVAFAAKSGH